jgi:predicted TIM-barrel fold metal-dependent hydrolase
MTLADYQPRSMLHVPEHHVARPQFPALDFHAHLTWSSADGSAPPKYLGETTDLLAVMDRKNVRAMVHLTGGYGEHLRCCIRDLQQAHPGRFFVFTEPMWNRAGDPECARTYARDQADEIERAARDGARGLKVLKTLGLFLRQGGTSLVKVDDPRFDPMWEACGGLGLPVAIHVSDPEAFFLPIDRFNERYEELHNHPDWSFCGRDFPSDRELQEARNRVVARHPKTQFVVLHVGNNAENLAYVSECMDRYPNMTVDIAARIGELGRQPREARRFVERYQDRVLFGTDAVPNGVEFPQQLFGDKLYEIYYRFLETEDEYFDYAPAPVPPQGRWRIYGLGLGPEVLRKVYCENAARLLRL